MVNMNFLTACKVLLTGKTFVLLITSCRAQENCGDYYCEQGTCCGERLCCTHYYYKTWWFWIIWCLLALLCCCCFYQKRRFQEKIRERMLRTYRDNQMNLPPAEPAPPTVPYSVPDGQHLFAPVFNQGQEIKLPAYDEISDIPQAPPAYDAVCNDNDNTTAPSRISDSSQGRGESPVFTNTEGSQDTGYSGGGQSVGLETQRSGRERHDTENSVAPLLGDSDQETPESCSNQSGRRY